MRFEWDTRKDQLNREKHGLGFLLAARVFADECRILEINRIDEQTGEQRWLAIGRAGGLAVYTVCHVYRSNYHGEEVIRIISARGASERESRRYFQEAAD